ncbi:MAG: molecular chaperone HtpG [Flavobacteriales bacterium]|jgi:molecular chaperone HtpG|nr:molecular chaperone HtpG [Flavobacteriales bacterium]
MATITEEQAQAKQGTISVHTENIFPIIKKFLYSDHEIFLRELVSNAVDATQKVKVLSAKGELKEELGELNIEVRIDEKEGTLTISDRGVGLTAEEVEKYINQIAFSGAEEFLEKYKGEQDAPNIIGHFGLGFYSAFMVADKVELVSRSWQPSAEAVHWTCEGSTSFSLGKGERKERGTDVILHIAADSKEFLSEARVRGILKKYCSFLPVPILFGEEESGEGDKKEKKPAVINNTDPAWTKHPTKLKDEDYKALYHELYPFSEDPLFHIHLNVDHPFKLTGVLYFPKLKNDFDPRRNKVQLYSEQVFVTDDVSAILPEFLTLLNGVIDSPDIPLNVSRSYLQSDANVKKISGHITKKVADKLKEMFNKDRKDLEAKWDDIKVFIEYGMLTDEKFFEAAQDFNLLKDSEGNFHTLEELREKTKALQTDKDGNLVLLYATDKEGQHSFIQAAKGRGYEVVLLDGPLTAHVVQRLEMKHENLRFARVDADTLDKLVPKEEKHVGKLSEEEIGQLKPAFEAVIGKDQFHLQFEPMGSEGDAVVITRPEFMRRMREQQLTGGMRMMGEMPEMMNLVVNTDHPLTQTILEAKTDKRKEKLSKQAVDLALLGQGLLKGEALTAFLRRSVELIK